jgi:hypothetical protein
LAEVDKPSAFRLGLYFMSKIISTVVISTPFPAADAISTVLLEEPVSVLAAWIKK